MLSRKMSLFEFWSSKRERGALLERANRLRLLPSQLKRLLGDSGVREALQNARTVSLLPPVGTEVFRCFTRASLEEIQRKHEAQEKEQENRKKNKEVAEKDQSKPASDLKAGRPLPFIYGDTPSEHLNTPLEELDPYYLSQKTFVVLGKGNIIHRFNAEPACYLLSPFSALRTSAIKILTHSLFIMVTILTNCVFMTLSDPSEWSKTVEYVFTAIYTFETIIKVVSRGVCVGCFTFLRDPWNWLDVIVISTAYLSEFVDLRKFSALRTVPRILKIIPVIPGLKTTVEDVVQLVKRLAGVIVLMVFSLSVFALIAMQLFMGSLKQKCVIQPFDIMFSNFTQPFYDNKSEHFDFNKFITSSENLYFLPGNIDPLLCGNNSDAGVCPEGFFCARGGRNPNYGYTSYDSFGWSLLALFRIMTKDFWDNLVMLTLRAQGKTYLAFFMLVAFPGCFCLFGLAVSVIAMATSEQEEARVAEAKQKEEEFSQILEVLKRKEEEEQAACMAELLEKQDVENKKSKKHMAMDEFGEDQTSCPPCWFVFADLLLKWNCCGCWRWLKERLYIFITNPFFDLGIVVCLVLNILFMAIEHYPMTVEFEWQLSFAHLVFTAIFTAEMVFKLVAMDPYGYFQVSWHVFDSIIVVISLLELGLVDFEGLSVLRSFRLMRAFRLARWWPTYHMFMKTIWISVRALRNLTLLLVITVFIFAVAGMQMFQKDYKDCVCRIAMDCELPRWHMSDFFHAFLVVVRVLCGEWIETMWDCMEVSGQAVCLIFFIMLVIIGNLLVLNLFLTLLLTSFSSDSLVTPEEKEINNVHVAISQIKSWILGQTLTLLGKKNHVKPDHTAVMKDNRKECLALKSVTSDQPVSEVKTLSGNHGNLTSNFDDIESQREFEKLQNEEEEKKCDDVQKHPEVQQGKDEGHKGDTPEDCCSDKCYHCCPCLDIDTSQGGGRVWSNFRSACLSIVQHKFFETFIIFIILLSSAALVFEDVHLQHRQVLKTAVEKADQLFTYLFLWEMLLKWIAFGLKKYFTSGWCWLDFLILDVSLVSLTADMLGFSELGAVQFVRTLRALGPLRAVSRFQGLRLVVQVLVRTLPSFCDMLLAFLQVWLIFSIAGVNLFAGKFYYCYNETSEEIFLVEHVNNKSDCLSLMMENYTEVRWKNIKSNYDSVMSGYLTLLQLVASAGWHEVMYAAVDSREVELQPVYESNIYIYLYFICAIIFCSFFTLNFFIRGIIHHLQKEKIRKHIFMTEEQQKYPKAIQKFFARKPPRPQNRCQAWLFDLVTKPYYEVFMVVLICLNMAPLLLETDAQSIEKEFILYWLHFFFIIIFFIEFVLKIVAFRQHYFTNGWNIIDFVVIIVSIGGLFVGDVMERYFVTPSFFAVLRLARIVRILHLIHCARGIRRLLLAFMMSLPGLLNIGLLLFLIMFTFSIFAMFNFAYVKRGAMIDDMFNFETFGSSMICLFMVGTSTGWDGLLIPIRNTPPDCNPYMENPGSTVRGDCGHPTIGIVFFATYIPLLILLVVHLYITIVLETFNSEDSETLCDKDLQRFYKTWKKFDPEATQFILYSKLSDFCDTLQDPLRIPKPNTNKLIHMDLPLFPGDKIHCVDVLLTLAAQVSDSAEEMDTLKARMEEMFMVNLSKVSHEPISSTLQRKQEEVAAMVIQKAYRKHLQEHGEAEKKTVESEDGGGGVSGVSGVLDSSHPCGASE